MSKVKKWRSLQIISIPLYRSLPKKKAVGSIALGFERFRWGLRERERERVAEMTASRSNAGPGRDYR